MIKIESLISEGATTMEAPIRGVMMGRGNLLTKHWVLAFKVERPHVLADNCTCLTGSGS